MGNFANSVRNLKYPDSYKGKGIWYKKRISNIKARKESIEMKKNTINTNLIKSLINSDFLLIEKKKNKNKHNSRFESLTTSFNKQEISLLDPLETLKTLKQIIRLFHFAKTETKQKLDMHFFIDEENTTLSYLIKNLLNTELINSQASFESTTILKFREI